MLYACVCGSVVLKCVAPYEHEMGKLLFVRNTLSQVEDINLDFK